MVATVKLRQRKQEKHGNKSNFSKDEKSKEIIFRIGRVKQLLKTDCKSSELKRAFLFSCLTELRLSDVQKLKWSDLSELEGVWRITFHQQKTKCIQYHDISEQAVRYSIHHIL